MRHYVITNLEKARARAIMRLIKRRCGDTSSVWCICRKDSDGVIRRAIVCPDYILKELTPMIKKMSRLYTGIVFKTNSI